MTNDGPSPFGTSYQGGLNLRDPEGRLKGHVGVTATPDAVKVDLQHYTADGSGLVTAFHTITALEAQELAFALQRAVEATEAGPALRAGDGACDGTVGGVRVSELDDAYRAAACAQWERFAELEGRPEWGPGSEEGTTRALWENLRESTETGIDAFLAHLADNPPETAVTAAFIAFGKGEDAQDAMRLALSAALRSIATEKAPI